MAQDTRPLPADAIAPITTSIYPEPFASRMQGRTKRKLGDHFGLTNFGINLTTLAPGAISALLHYHSVQDEFIYVLKGSPTLILGNDEFLLKEGDCCGFRAGMNTGAQLVNRSNDEAIFLEIGDRLPGDSATYPDDDLAAEALADGSWLFTHKSGEPY